MRYLKAVFIVGYGLVIAMICFKQLGLMNEVSSVGAIEHGIFLGISLLIIGFPASVLAACVVWLLVTIFSLVFPEILNANALQWGMMATFTYVGGVIQWVFVFPFLFKKMKGWLKKMKSKGSTIRK